jgi:hypothetical protein
MYLCIAGNFAAHQMTKATRLIVCIIIQANRSTLIDQAKDRLQATRGGGSVGNVKGGKEQNASTQRSRRAKLKQESGEKKEK